MHYELMCYCNNFFSQITSFQPSPNSLQKLMVPTYVRKKIRLTEYKKISLEL